MVLQKQYYYVIELVLLMEQAYIRNKKPARLAVNQDV